MIFIIDENCTGTPHLFIILFETADRLYHSIYSMNPRNRIIIRIEKLK